MLKYVVLGVKSDVLVVVSFLFFLVLLWLCVKKKNKKRE